MKKLILILLVLLSSSVLTAQNIGQSLTSANDQTAILTAFDAEAITIDATAGGVGFTAAKINPTCTDCLPGVARAQRADCVTEPASANIRVSITSTAPTSSVGQLIAAGTSFTVYGYTNISTFKAIRTASTSVAMYCVYSRN